MADRRKQPLGVQFDGKLSLEFHRAKVTSDAGLLAFRESDEAFRLTENASMMLTDPRHGKNTRHTTLPMLRQAIYGRLAGYDVNDAARLRGAPPCVKLLAVGRRRRRQRPPAK